MLNMSEINVLGNVCEDLVRDISNNLDESLKLTYALEGNLLELRLSMVVYFAGERSLQIQMPPIQKKANDLFVDGLSKIKAAFKEDADRTLKTSEVKRNSDVELISATSNSPRKIALYRCNLVLEVE